MAKDIAKKRDTNLPEDEAPETPAHEDRIDEFAIAGFERLGYTGRLPDSLVRVYTQFKRRKDALRPGRLSPEGFAFVTLIADLADRRIEP